MIPTAKTELLAALANSEQQVLDAVAILSGIVTDAEWNRAYGRILELRDLQKELRVKIAAIDQAK